jgi:hypothetical protein
MQVSPALTAEVKSASLVLNTPAGLWIAGGEEQLLLLEDVAKVVTNARSLRDIDQIRRPDREAVSDQ